MEARVARQTIVSASALALSRRNHPPQKDCNKMYATSACNKSKTANDNFFAADQLFLWWLGAAVTREKPAT